jgi:GNAT superfamily N-acetyltransferase
MQYDTPREEKDRTGMEKTSNKDIAGPFFTSYRWNYLASAALEGAHGEVHVNTPHRPAVAVLFFPHLNLRIYGGNPHHPSGVESLMACPPQTALLAGSPSWEPAFHRAFEGRLVSIPRYAFTGESLDREALACFAKAVPVGFSITRLTASQAAAVAGEQSEFAADHLGNFSSVDDFMERGFGFGAVGPDGLACLATTFIVCGAGVEIQINTREKYRRKGLAAATAAKFILHCLENGLDPNWDAANLVSVSLAQKLGYTLQGTYTMYFIRGQGPEREE